MITRRGGGFGGGGGAARLVPGVTAAVVTLAFSPLRCVARVCSLLQSCHITSEDEASSAGPIGQRPDSTCPNTWQARSVMPPRAL